MSSDLTPPESLFYAGTPEEELGPFVLVKLPLELVRALRETMRHIPLNDAAPPLEVGLMIDELNHQLQQQVVGDKIYTLRRAVGGGRDDRDVLVNGEYLGYIEHRSDGTWVGDITEGNGPPSKPFATREEAIAYVVR